MNPWEEFNKMRERAFAAFREIYHDNKVTLTMMLEEWKRHRKERRAKAWKKQEYRNRFTAKAKGLTLTYYIERAHQRQPQLVSNITRGMILNYHLDRLTGTEDR